MSTIKVKCWREDKNVPLPKYMHNDDACCDLYANEIEFDFNSDKVIVHTGLHVEIPENYEIEIRPRSSLTKTEWYIPNSPGTIDVGYRGEITVIFKLRDNLYIHNCLHHLHSAIRLIPIENKINRENVKTFLDYAEDDLNKSKSKFPYSKNDRIAQMLIRKRDIIQWEEVNSLDDLTPSERGDKGYGSTGL